MDESTEEIRRRADLVEVVGQHVALRPAGADRWKACCPFHDEKTPSFNVSREKGFYKCFGCLDENELIWTADGLKRISEVEAGERVLDRNGHWQPVLATEHKRGVALSVETAAFRHDPLILTPDHRCIFVREAEARSALPYLYLSAERGTRFKGSYRKFKSKEPVITEDDAAQMRVGDFLLFPVISASARQAADIEAKHIIAPYKIGKKVRRITRLPVSRMTAFLYGLYLAEGSTNPRSVRWTFHIQETQLAEQVACILEEEFGLAATHLLVPHKNIREVICSKTDLARQLECWFGKGVTHKKIPAEVLSWPEEIQRALLEGYRCGDGSCRGASVSVSRELSYGLFALAVQCRMNPSLGYQSSYTDKKDVPHRECWHLFSRSQEGLNGFFETVQGVLYYWSRIRKIETSGEERNVVDITVANTHSFVTKMATVHNCGATGDVFKFVQQIENLSFPEAKRQLAERYGVALPRGNSKELTPEQQAAYAERDRLLRIMAATIAFFRDNFNGNPGMAARDYARQRGLSRSTLEKFSIGYAPDAWDALRDFLVRKYGYKAEDAALAGLIIERENEDGCTRYYDRYRHRLMFPIWDERGQVIAFGGRALDGGRTGTPEAKYINSPEGPLFKKSRTLYAWHLARAEVGKRESIIITEGYMDAIALHEAGFSHTVATLGTALTTQHVQMLRRLAPKTVYLCYDGDSAGMRAALRAGPLFDANGLHVRVVALPKEDDPDTFIRKHGEIGFQNALDNARLLAQYRVEMALDGFDFSNIGERAEAIQNAAEIIANVPVATEKEEYISWLAQRWAREENITTSERLLMIEKAVRQHVNSAGQKQHQNQPPPLPFNPKPFNPKFPSRFQEPQVPSANREEEAQGVSQMLSQTASGQLSGVGRAERLLVGVMLNSPSSRPRILEAMPAPQWTQEVHYEIVGQLRKLPDGEPVNPTALLEVLSPEAAGLASELMLADEAQVPATPEVITDCIKRIENHWARQREREILDLVKGKLERNEPIAPEEREAYTQALIATKRKSPLPKDD